MKVSKRAHYISNQDPGDHFLSNFLRLSFRVAGVGWLSGTAAESLRAFGERVFANFATKALFFTIAGKQAICGCQKTYTHTGTFPQTPCLMFRYVLWVCTGCTKAFQKWALQKRKLSESSPKALRKLSESSLKALQKLSESSTKTGSTKALRKISESSPKALRKLSESSPKALWKLSGNSTEALRKLFESGLSESRLTFVGSPSKVS